MQFFETITIFEFVLKYMGKMAGAGAEVLKISSRSAQKWTRKRGNMVHRDNIVPRYNMMQRDIREYRYRP
jgi:hypothetical protein